MNSITLVGPRTVQKVFSCFVFSRKLSDHHPFQGDEGENGFECVEESWKRMGNFGAFDAGLDEIPNLYENESLKQGHFLPRRGVLHNVNIEARGILDILQQDGPEFDTISALNELHIKISEHLVREVLFGILESIDCSSTSKTRSAKLGYKFFAWAGQQKNYRHTVHSYHLIMKIFSVCEEFRALWRIVDEMGDRGYRTNARTFHILICSCGGAGVARKVVQKFLKSKKFNYRPFKSSFNAVLYCLLVLKQYKLIEWVYRRMTLEGHSPDILTYNVLLFAKCRLGKYNQFYRLYDEMGRNGFSPDMHTYNILLHVHGRGNNLLAALNLLNHMKAMGLEPSVLHFTTLMDGFSRAGNMDACKYFFDEMIRNGCIPDVVSYTVMITGYIVASKLEKAQELFDEMVAKEQLPNVFTYNSMIRGLCMAGKFKEACLMLKDMEFRGCNPNFAVYSTLVSSLRNAGKLAEAHKVIRQMMQKGKYSPLLAKFNGNQR